VRMIVHVAEARGERRLAQFQSVDAGHTRVDEAR
jgi:hypothetical protein